MVATTNGKTSFDMLAPYTGGQTVTPSDTVDGSTEFTKFARALWIGVAGDVTLITTEGTTLLFKAVPVGELRVQCKQVKATGTAATNMLALW